MSSLDDTLEKQRALRPPEALSAEIERAVMRRVFSSRPATSPAFRRSLALAATAAAVGVVLVILSLPHLSPHAPEAAFVESVILLDDHVCIWLEPAAPSGSPRP